LLAAGTLAVALAGFAAATPAVGKEPAVVVVANPDLLTRRITYADLNLASLPGQASLNRRVAYAVSSLCHEATDGPRSLYSLANRLCGESAWKQARPQISAAVDRAGDLALTGTSPIAAAAGIAIVLPK